MNQLPQAIKEEKINILGHEIKIVILENGQRIIEQKDLEEFFKEVGLDPSNNSV